VNKVLKLGLCSRILNIIILIKLLMLMKGPKQRTVRKENSFIKVDRFLRNVIYPTCVQSSGVAYREMK
jgi:hypothetical protein